MEYFCSGWPDLWAIVRGEPYIVGECGWNTEVETTQSFSGTPVVHAQTISGFAKLFGKERFEVYDEQGVPDTIEMKLSETVNWLRSSRRCSPRSSGCHTTTTLRSRSSG